MKVLLSTYLRVSVGAGLLAILTTPKKIPGLAGGKIDVQFRFEFRLAFASVLEAKMGPTWRQHGLNIEVQGLSEAFLPQSWPRRSFLDWFGPYFCMEKCAERHCKRRAVLAFVGSDCASKNSVENARAAGEFAFCIC